MIRIEKNKNSPSRKVANLPMPMMEMESSMKPAFLTSGASGRVTAIFSLRSLRSLLLLFNSFLLLLLLPFRRRTVVVSEKSAAAEEDKASVVVRVPAAMVRRSRDAEVAARRAMAIRRLGSKDEEGEERRRTKREFSLFSTSRGDTLFTQSWTPLAVRSKGLVVLMHGLNEHSGRYNRFASQLNDCGVKVYAMDWIVAVDCYDMGTLKMKLRSGAYAFIALLILGGRAKEYFLSKRTFEEYYIRLPDFERTEHLMTWLKIGHLD